MELAGEEQNRKQADKEQPGVFSTHVINKTKLRQERLSGQAIPGGQTDYDIASAFAIKVRPFPRFDKAGPVKGMLATFAFQHRELSLAKSLPSAEAMLQAGVVIHNHFARYRVAHRPQAHV
ncbi:MAG TPA: hypothetical protein VIH74_03330 [Candidatus Acidoferrum sp.]